MDGLAEAVKRLNGATASSTTIKDLAGDKYSGERTEAVRRGEFACPLCSDLGYTVERVDGKIQYRECACWKRKRSLRLIEKSGLSEILDRCTLENYQTTEPWQANILHKAKDYIAGGGDKWFVITGTPGSGKTHICTAIAGAFIQAGKSVKYMLWRAEAPRLKALVNEREEYEAIMRTLQDVDLLYIDDFFKGSVKEADVNLAFEILNDRYNRMKPTVISGERDIEELMELDAAIASRIYERSRGFCIRTPDGKNWRLRP
nr:MAG TPA: replicative helicase [Caudoviricetes sp.]